jgi:DNA invertase Pin-like site-specific DNA recombinase
VLHGKWKSTLLYFIARGVRRPSNLLRAIYSAQRDGAARHGYTVYKEYVEYKSGGTGKRSEFQALFPDAHQRRFDLVLFWSLDRFSREGALPTLQYYKAGE